MKQILTILLILIASSANAQQHFSRGNATSIDSNKGTAVARYTMLQRDTAKSTVWTTNGGAANVGGKLYLYDGSKWASPTSGVSEAVLIDTSNAIHAWAWATFSTGGGAVDSYLYATRAWRQKGIDSVNVNVALRELLFNKVTSFASPDNTTYPTTAAVNSLVGSYKLKSDSFPTDGYSTRARLQKVSDSINAIIAALPTYTAGWGLTGSFRVDSYAVSSRARLQKVGDSVAALIPSVSGYVPYTGATTNLDMGTHRVTAQRLNIDTIVANTSAGIHIHNTAQEDIFIIGAGGAKTASLYGAINLDANKIQNSTDTVLTTGSTGTIGKAALASVYLKIATAASTYQPIGSYLQLSDTVNNVSTRSWRQKGVDSLNAQDALRVKYTDTSGMLTPYLRTVNAVTATSTTTLTNKRWTARVTSQTTVSATPSINTDNQDIWKVTAQTADITSMTTNLTGTPVDGDILEIQITGTAARAITWGSSFVSSTVTLPTTTTTTATLTVILQYYSTSSYGNNKWVCVNYF